MRAKRTNVLDREVIFTREDDERGAVLLELAVVLPVLLLLGLGALEFGNLFYQYHLMANAASDAARYAASRSDPDQVCTSGSTAQNDVKTVAGLTGSGQISASFAISCTAGTNNSNYYYRGPALIRSVTVTASAPYTPLGFMGFLRLVAPTLTVSHQERIIGGR